MFQRRFWPRLSIQRLKCTLISNSIKLWKGLSFDFWSLTVKFFFAKHRLFSLKKFIFRFIQDKVILWNWNKIVPAVFEENSDFVHTWAINYLMHSVNQSFPRLTVKTLVWLLTVQGWLLVIWKCWNPYHSAVISTFCTSSMEVKKTKNKTKKTRLYNSSQ